MIFIFLILYDWWLTLSYYIGLSLRLLIRGTAIAPFTLKEYLRGDKIVRFKLSGRDSRNSMYLEYPTFINLIIK